jgi:(p)ppGpp synthase/HD superfamily hydrolase
MATLQKAIEIAVDAHKDVFDKSGQYYILHPLTVMARVGDKTNGNEEAMMAAVLHDVVEDTDINFDELKRLGFSRTVIDAVDSVTKRDGENYMDFVKRSSMNTIGRIIKLEDIKHNMDITRLINRGNLGPKDMIRLEKYAKAYDYLVGGRLNV